MTFESPLAFAKRTNLPKDVVYNLAKEGVLKAIQTSKCRLKINVEASLEKLEQLAEEEAADRATRVPVYRKRVREVRQKAAKAKIKRGGRPPDSVRLARKEGQI